MRFTVLAALAAFQAMASRPDFRRATSSSRAVRLGDLVLQASKGGDRLGALRKASAQISSLIDESGAGDVTEEDAALLRQVIVVVEENLYSSLDDAHDADVAALDAGVGTASSCNADIARRQRRGGDLYDLELTVEASQAELDRLQAEVDAATELNSTTYAKLINLIQLISPPPACPEFPSPRTLAAVDVYFQESAYVIWYTAQQAAYQSTRAVWEAADAALVAANQAFAVQLGIRDAHYCAYRDELVAGCNSFSRCYVNADAYYSQQLVPRVLADQEDRIECYRAGETIIYQINFLLGEVETQETPPIDTSRYEIDFPAIPPKGVCDLSPLDSAALVPKPVCPTGGDDLTMLTGDCKVDFTSGDLSQCCDCFPEEGMQDHLRSPCGINPSTIPLPDFSAQRTANCPFLGTLVNEGALAHDWMINETVFNAVRFRIPAADVTGHFQSNFRDHSVWQDATNTVLAHDTGRPVACNYFYLNPLDMEGMSNEHISSTSINDCATDWDSCAFQCSSAGEFRCQLQDPSCHDTLPNAGAFDAFVEGVLAGSDRQVITTCQLDAYFENEISVAHDAQMEERSINDFHFHSEIPHDCGFAGRSITVDGVTLVQQSEGINGGQIGGSIEGGTSTLVRYFGRPSSVCQGGSEMTVDEFRTVSIDRRFPCSFDREGLFQHLQRQTPSLVDRRARQRGWLDVCAAACTSAPLLPQASSANLWSGTSGKFTFSGTSNPKPETVYNNAYLDGATVVNGAFEVTVNFVGIIAGIGMRGSQAGGDFFLCRLDSRPREGLRIIRSPNTLISPSPSAPDAEGVDIRMRMEVSGNSIKCYKDGELVAEATDNNFPTHGELLLVTFNATATFTIESCEA